MCIWCTFGTGRQDGELPVVKVIVDWQKLVFVRVPAAALALADQPQLLGGCGFFIAPFDPRSVRARRRRRHCRACRAWGGAAAPRARSIATTSGRGTRGDRPGATRAALAGGSRDGRRTPAAGRSGKRRRESRCRAGQRRGPSAAPPWSPPRPGRWLPLLPAARLCAQPRRPGGLVSSRASISVLWPRPHTPSAGVPPTV